MQLINRSAITVTFKKSFIDWHNHLMPDMPIKENFIGESSTYLIKELFDNAGDVIKKHYKEIFETELLQMWTDENDWPPKITLKLFYEWFSIEVSDYVFDMQNINLGRSKLEVINKSFTKNILRNS